MFSLSFELEGLEELALLKAEAERELNVGMLHAVDEAGWGGVNYAKAHHDYQDRTGSLTGDSYADTFGTFASGYYSDMVWPTKYAKYVERGTRPHIISPKRGGRLVFEWNGETFIGEPGQSVHHPGTRAYGFASDAYFWAVRILDEKLKLTVTRIEMVLSR